jgi:hypothetical protein
MRFAEMATFGGYPLFHVLNVQIQESRVINDRLIPSATVGHRTDQTAGGRVITVQGEIRDDPDYVLRLEELRVRADDVARDLDLEDGSATINAKLGPIEAVWTVEGDVERPSYSVTFYETS